MATLSEIADLDSGIVSSEATPESQKTPTSAEDNTFSDKTEATSEAAIEELVSSAVAAASIEIQEPKQNSIVSSSVTNDEDEDDDENYEMIPEQDSDLSIITVNTSEENTPTRDIEVTEDSKGEVDKELVEELTVPSQAVPSHEEKVIVDNEALPVVTISSQELAKDVVVSTVTSVEATPVDDEEVDDTVKESEPMSFDSFSIISESSLDNVTSTNGIKNVENIKESTQDDEALNELSEDVNTVNNLDPDSKIISNSVQGAETVNELAKEAEIIIESAKESESVIESDQDIKIIGASAQAEEILSDWLQTEIVKKTAQDAENISKSSQEVENISELNQEAELISRILGSGLAQDDQNTSSLSTTVTKVEQDKDSECYEMIAEPDSGVATPESLALTPTSEEVVVPPPVEKKEEVKEEVIEQVVTSGVAAAAASAAPAPAVAAEPQPTAAAKETTSATSTTSTKATAKSEEKVKEQAKPSSSTTTVAKVDTANELDDDDEEENEDCDESLGERIWGLTEMFPESLRSGSLNTVSATLGLLKGTYEISRQVVWIAVSSSLLLFAPVMFELERINVEEMMKQDRNRLVLGPGSAMSGPPPPGLMSGPAR